MLNLLYYPDKITVLNPNGHIGILTLWSRVDIALKKLGEPAYLAGMGVAAVANLYGDGISQLIANLLANPQIRVLHIAGTNRSGSLEELLAFFSRGVEEVSAHGTCQHRIRGTNRLVNPAISGPEMFSGEVPAILTHVNFEEMRAALPTSMSYTPSRRQPLHIDLVEPAPDVYPSIQSGHQIVGDSIIDAWVELLFHIHRFGEPVQLTKGKRRELYNVKVLIRDPHWQGDDAYRLLNLDPERLRSYSRFLQSCDLPDDISYTYGHRLRTHYGFDTIERVVQRLAADPQDRKCYIALWDQRHDLEWPDSDSSHPCWVGGFFRLVGGQLTLSCTFRTHRAYTAWVENAHSLMDLAAYVAGRLNHTTGWGVVVGPLTIMSHSISIDPTHLSEVEGIIAGRRWRMRNDDRGELMFSLHDGQIVVEHRCRGVLLKRYAHQNAEIISHQLALDHVVSDLGHALYVGRQLGKLQMCLSNDLVYEEA